MLAGRHDGCRSIGARSLDALLAVDVGVFLDPERLNTSRIGAPDYGFHQYRLGILLGNELGDRRGESFWCCRC